MVTHLPLEQVTQGSTPCSPTKREKESVKVEALRAPPAARSAAKPFLYSAESCRLDKKKFEPTRFAKNANSSQLFFAPVRRNL